MYGTQTIGYSSNKPDTLEDIEKRRELQSYLIIEMVVYCIITVAMTGIARENGKQMQI